MHLFQLSRKPDLCTLSADQPAIQGVDFSVWFVYCYEFLAMTSNLSLFDLTLVTGGAGEGEAMAQIEPRDTKDGGRDILDTLPQELDIEVLSSANKVAISVGGTPVRVDHIVL